MRVNGKHPATYSWSGQGPNSHQGSGNDGVGKLHFDLVDSECRICKIEVSEGVEMRSVKAGFREEMVLRVSDYFNVSGFEDVGFCF